jgi:hypothetical protein
MDWLAACRAAGDSERKDGGASLGNALISLGLRADIGVLARGGEWLERRAHRRSLGFAWDDKAKGGASR